MTELAKEKTCRPGGRAGNSARKAPTGKAKLTMRWRHYRKFRFSQNNFPKGEAQKFTYSIILGYFTLSHLQEQLSACCPEPAVETLKMKSTLDGTSATRLSLEKFASGKQTVLKKPGYLVQVWGISWAKKCRQQAGREAAGRALHLLITQRMREVGPGNNCCPKSSHESHKQINTFTLWEHHPHLKASGCSLVGALVFCSFWTLAQLQSFTINNCTLTQYKILMLIEMEKVQPMTWIGNSTTITLILEKKKGFISP